jgi:uncharacterized membrane protein YraQ (UPF0718 family)
MKLRVWLLVVVLFLFILPQVNAIGLPSAENVCFDSLGGDRYEVEETYREKTNEVRLLQEGLDRDNPEDFRRMLELEEELKSQRKHICEYLNDPRPCYTCVDETKAARQKELNLGSLKSAIPSLFFAILALISLGYLIVAGIYYLVKRELIGQKWMIPTSILVFMLSLFLSFLFIVNSLREAAYN